MAAQQIYVSWNCFFLFIWLKIRINVAENNISKNPNAISVLNVYTICGHHLPIMFTIFTNKLDSYVTFVGIQTPRFSHIRNAISQIEHSNESKTLKKCSHSPAHLRMRSKIFCYSVQCRIHLVYVFIICISQSSAQNKQKAIRNGGRIQSHMAFRPNGQQVLAGNRPRLWKNRLRLEASCIYRLESGRL